MAVEVQQAKSTYRQPATVIETRGEGLIEGIQKASEVFGNTLDSLVTLQNAKLKKTLDENNAMMDSIAIDPEEYLKRLEESTDYEKQAFFNQANDIFDENTRLTLAIEKGLYDRDDYRMLMGKRTEQISALNQLIGLASSEDMVKKAWIENREEAIKNATTQGGDSMLTSDFINARNIFAKGMPGSVERVFKNGIAYYKFNDDGTNKLSPEYKNKLHKAETFLSGVVPKVPQLNKDFDKLLQSQELVDKNGRLTETAKKLGKSGYEKRVGDIIGSISATYAKDRHATNSTWLEILGEKDELQYSIGRGTGKADGRPAGILLSLDGYSKFNGSMEKFLRQYVPLYQAPEEEKEKETAGDRGRRIKETDRKDRLNAFMELFEQRKTQLGLGKNKGGVFTGTINLAEKVKNDKGEDEFQIKSDQEKALNDIGFQIINVDPNLGMTTIALQGEKGDTRIDIANNMAANDFARELMMAKGAKEKEAREFAEQFDLDGDGIPDNFESGLSTDIYLDAANFK